MKKKVLLLVGLIVIGLCAWETQAMSIVSISIPTNHKDVEDPPPGYEKINLQGSLMFGVGPNAVVAGANENSVYIGFNQDFGNVSISIYNEAGLVVYSTVVNTSVQQVVIIPFSSAASGTYTIELNSANGYVDGDFEHD